MSCHQLFVLLCHSQQAVPALQRQLHSQRRLPGIRHAHFLRPSSRTSSSSERAQDFPTVPIFVTEKVHVGIERNRAIPTKWRTGSSRRAWAVHGIWWIRKPTTFGIILQTYEKVNFPSMPAVTFFTQLTLWLPNVSITLGCNFPNKSANFARAFLL